VEHRKWQGASVLVTGAGGFIGSHLVEYLVRQGASVRAFVRYNSRSDFGRLEDIAPEVLTEVDVFLGDLTNPEATYGAMEAVDTVLHLGALIPIPYSYKHPREFVQANVEGAINVLESARRRDVTRIVHVSSSEVYGTAQTVPISEDHPLNAQSPYAATKIGADQLALSFWRSFETPVVIARPFNTYGPRQSARAVIPTIITQALGLGVVHIGSTAPTRDFLFVEDTARGIAACGSALGVEGEVLNLGTGEEYSIGEVARRIFDQLGEEIELVEENTRLRPAGSEVERLLADPTRARARLAWRSEVSLDAGLERTIDWIRGSLATYKPERYVV
jgi:NAD dependent epimerase/dehydratase